MRSIFTLAIKDLRLLSRDWFGLFWIFAFPLMFALFFGTIFSGVGSPSERTLSLAVIDEENSAGSKEFLARLGASKALTLENVERAQAEREVATGKRAAYLVVKSGFETSAGLFAGKPRTLE